MARQPFHDPTALGVAVLFCAVATAIAAALTDSQWLAAFIGIGVALLVLGTNAAISRVLSPAEPPPVEQRPAPAPGGYEPSSIVEARKLLRDTCVAVTQVRTRAMTMDEPDEYVFWSVRIVDTVYRIARLVAATDRTRNPQPISALLGALRRDTAKFEQIVAREDDHPAVLVVDLKDVHADLDGALAQARTALTERM